MSNIFPKKISQQALGQWTIGLLVAASLTLAGCQSTLPLSQQSAGRIDLETPRVSVPYSAPGGSEGMTNAQPLLWDGLQVPSQPESQAPAEYTGLWQRLRAGMKVPTVGGEAAKKLLVHRRWYEANGAHLARVFKRAQRYLFDIVEQVEEQGLPAEIALLPAVESAFIPTARSSAAADGLWQFIGPTGRRFNLKQHMFQDDRRNVRAATQAALRYLKELQARYNGDYQLALAAYNCGEGCIDVAIRRARAKGLEGKFEDLDLNQETANYVPRLLALTQMVTRAVDDRREDNLPPIANAAYYAAVPIHRDIDIKRAANFAGLSIDEFRALNPQHKKPVIVAASNAEVLVPLESEQTFTEAMTGYQGPLSTWGIATVSKRMPVEELALKHGTSAASMREVNSIPKGHLVSAGSTIVIPRLATGHDIPAMVAENATLITVPTMVRATVKVQKKDNWSTLAHRLDVNVAQLKGWNPGAKHLRAGAMALNLPIDIAERIKSVTRATRVASNSVVRVKLG